MAERTEELKREIEDTREHLGTTLDTVEDRVRPGRIARRRWDDVKSSTSGMTQRLMGAPRQAASAAADRTRAAGSGLSDQAGGLVEGAKHLPDAVQSGTQGAPLVAGALAFGLGVLIGSLPPATDAEAQLVDRVAEPLESEVRSLASDVASTVKDEAQEAAQHAKEAATDAVEQVKSTATDAAGEVKSQAADAKDAAAEKAKQGAADVKDQASS